MARADAAAAKPPEDATESQVVAFLQANPEFLRLHPELLAVLAAPAREMGDGVVDMQQVMIRQLQDAHRKHRQTYKDLVSTTRGNLVSQNRVHAAILALLAATTFENLIEIVTTDFGVHLDVDVVTLCVESDGDCARGQKAGVRVLESGVIDDALGEGKICALRPCPSGGGAETIFGGGATLVKSEALLRLDIGPNAPTGLLAIGARSESRFHPNQGTELLCFLAKVTARSIRSWLYLPA
ncbi:MAG: DUF484 family protein [Proteobacteria bacterium]|nr:DUF484 family protein [Pseudomonadota bacterium]